MTMVPAPRGGDLSDDSAIGNMQIENARLRLVVQALSLRAWAFYVGGAAALGLFGAAIYWAFCAGKPLAADHEVNIAVYLVPFVGLVTGGSVIALSLFRAAFAPINREKEDSTSPWVDVVKEGLAALKEVIKSKTGD